MSAPIISVSTVLLRNSQGQVLTVRKRGTTAFMLPGGKPEPGERPEEAAVREVREELDAILDPSALHPLGVAEAPAANEPGHTVRATIFEHPPVPETTPTAEIEEIRWLDPLSRPLPPDLAPLLRDEILPLLTRGVGSVTVFTGARDGVDPRHRATARGLGETLAEDRITLVYGGGKVGLMGALADSAIAAGGRVVGVMPEHLVAREIAHPGLTDLHVVASMHERKQTMADLADAFVALPGGAGTLDELFEAWTWQQLGLHAKPIALIDADYWAPLITMLDHMVTEGFVRAEDRDTLIVASDPADALTQLRTWAPPTPKWR